MKDPYVLGFLGLPELTEYFEAELETRIIDHLQKKIFAGARNRICIYWTLSTFHIR